MSKKIRAGHLGGNIAGGDPKTYYPDLWNFLIKKFTIKSVLDIGCGEGHSLNHFKKNNIKTYGIDGLDQNVSICKSMGHIGEKVDFTESEFNTDLIFDLGWCCEVVEHVEKKYVINIIKTFKKCKIIAMTHAIPGQKGHHHVNCENWEYWVELMQMHNFRLLKNETKEARKYEPNFYFRKTGLIFENLDFEEEYVLLR